MMIERHELRANMELVWQPSGLRVKVVGITSPDTAQVEGPKGGTFTVQLQNLCKPPVVGGP